MWFRDANALAALPAVGSAAWCRPTLRAPLLHRTASVCSKQRQLGRAADDALPTPSPTCPYAGGQAATVGMLPPSSSEDEDDEEGEGEKKGAEGDKPKEAAAKAPGGQPKTAGKLPPSGSEVRARHTASLWP